MIVAHRGYAWRYPENTLEAFQAAVDVGARWVEVDVQLYDGVPVLSHDVPRGDEPPLYEFAAWLEARPEVTALVDLKGESLGEFGRDAVVSACMDVMRGNWHPISFDYEALAMAVEAGSRAPGWVVCGCPMETQAAAKALGVRWLIINQIFIRGDLPRGDWEWMVYEIENRSQARNALHRGAKWLETMAVGELIAELNLIEGDRNG